MADTESTTPRRTSLRQIFIGSDGLRAGWSLALFFAIAVILSLAAYSIHGPGTPAPGAADQPEGMILGEGISFVVIGGAAFLVSLIERRPFARYGLRGSRLLPDLLAGLGWGLAMLSLLVGVLALIGAVSFDGFAVRGGAALRYGALWFVGFALVGLLEEFLFRGFLHYTLARGVAGIVRAISPGNPRAATIGFWVAAFVFSVVLFAAAHLSNGGETALGIITVSLAGLVFVFALYRTGSLWWPIGFHAAWDWAQSFLYGVADSGHVSEGRLLASHPVGSALLSGGTTGPEGSVLVIPTLILSAFIIHRTLPRRATAFDA